MSNYKPVPVEAAQSIAEKYDKAIVIVCSHDPIHGLLHTTTYGTSPHNKAMAAQGGEIAARALGGLTDLAINFEDYRLAKARSLLAALKGVMAQIAAGVLVRSVADDADHGWALRQMALVMALKTADAAIEDAEKFISLNEKEVVTGDDFCDPNGSSPAEVRIDPEPPE